MTAQYNAGISDVYILYVSQYNKYNNLLFNDMGI